MSALDAILGQHAATTVLTRALSAARIGTGYLFEGPAGIGKEKAALAFAAEAIGNGDPAVIERALAGKHPDLRVFSPRQEGKGNIKVETVREDILPFAQFAPFEAPHAFLLFPDADISFPENQPESANALLKTLEEPRRGVHFIMLSSRPQRLLPTIRSRCQRLRFDRLDDASLDRILAAAGVNAEDRGPALALADGRADRALDLAVEGRARALLDRAIDIDDAARGRRPGVLLARSEELAKDEELGQTLEALAVYYRDLCCVCAGGGQELLRFRTTRMELTERAEGRSLPALLRAEALVAQAAKALEGQANPQITLDALLYGLAGVRG